MLVGNTHYAINGVMSRIGNAESSIIDADAIKKNIFSL